MTPKEKAEDLFKKMYQVRSVSSSDITKYFAKQCALIAVYEIIDSYIQEKNNGYIVSEKIIPYWQEVKHELENI
jgi:hypothetical protein